MLPSQAHLLDNTDIHRWNKVLACESSRRVHRKQLGPLNKEHFHLTTTPESSRNIPDSGNTSYKFKNCKHLSYPYHISYKTHHLMLFLLKSTSLTFYGTKRRVSKLTDYEWLLHLSSMRNAPSFTLPFSSTDDPQHIKISSLFPKLSATVTPPPWY